MCRGHQVVGVDVGGRVQQDVGVDVDGGEELVQDGVDHCQAIIEADHLVGGEVIGDLWARKVTWLS